MITQLYWLLWDHYPRSDSELPRPGQFVNYSGDKDMLIGFVAEVDYKRERFLICLFHPTDVNVSRMESVKESVEESEWMDLLDKAFKANPAIKAQWAEIMLK